tara:strand:- start:237 stop:722 length:486 start_codon:yes stop_codon:yes gene_type:complete
MAETIPGGYTFDPSVESIALEIIDYVIDNSVPKIAEQAHNTIMMSWDDEQGYSHNGSLFTWQRSPKSKRKNPILFDTGVLKSSIDIIFFNGGLEFKFEASGGSKYKSGATVEEVSSYNDYNPHTNVPKEYMAEPMGSEWLRIAIGDIREKIQDMMNIGKIY